MPDDNPREHKPLTTWQVLTIASFLAALVASVDFSGPYLLLIRAFVIGPFVLYRARYRPRSDSDETQQLQVGAARFSLRLPSTFEASVGKGVVPHGAGIILFQFLFKSSVGQDIAWHLFWLHPPAHTWSLQLAAVWLPVGLLVTLLTNREISDTRRFAWHQAPGSAFRSLFSSSERSKAWRFLRTPIFSLAVASALRLGIIIGTNRPCIALLADMNDVLDQSPVSQPPEPGQDLIRAVKIIRVMLPFLLAVLGIKLLAMAFICPLEVITTRLSVQRASTTPTLERDPEDSQQDAEGNQDSFEPMCRLRETPYTGLWNCLVSIVKEEGWRELYRGWWATLLFSGNGMTWASILTMSYW
ncbi:hypothetical protein BKA62DRAFT_698921 [Auriculariales sp. MPI-PUGE-AT-0066]|nr:hypothetical protein BKA62DRAFT_698921 [Auriculariales sp. MPI-PUGE-AT-0066]